MNIKENLAYLKYFGIKLTFSKMIKKIIVGDIDYAQGEFAHYINDANNNAIEDYLKKVCPITYNELLNGKYDKIDKDKDSFNYRLYNDPELKNNVIWTMWWQGEENAPILVKKCIDSMRKHSRGHKVIVLDSSNYKKYVKLPDIINQRFDQYERDNSYLKKITLDITQISDIIRAYLLYYYGGVWADSTMFFSGDISDGLFKDLFSTLGQDNEWYIGKGKWSTFFMAAPCGNGLVKYNYDMHIEYWSNKRYFVNYLMTDHMYDIAYKDKANFKELIDGVKCGNKKCLTVARNHDKACDYAALNEFLKKQSFHKLSWKWWTSEKDSEIVFKTSEGKVNWLGGLMNVKQ